MKIEKIMCIGATCDGLFISRYLNLRERGPVDNLGTTSYSMKGIDKLFNGDLYKSVINDNYYFSENQYDKYPLCNFDGYFKYYICFFNSLNK